jgi:UDP-N-acetyl-D-galactosamine dehydrogenase
MLKKRIAVVDANILVLGLTFKENCPDLRNTRVIDILDELGSYGAVIDVYDPWANPDEAKKYYGVDLTNEMPDKKYDALILAVSHREFLELGKSDLQKLCKQDAVIYDVKHVLPADVADGQL